jgi:hypothetical protein
MSCKGRKEDVSILGKGIPEGGEDKWKKKSVKKIQPVRHVIKPVHAASRRKRPTPRRGYDQHSQTSNIESW